MARPTTDEGAIRFLVTEVPELRPLLEEHVADNDGVLPYVVFESDFTRWFCEGVLADADLEPLRRFAAAVELLLDHPKDGVWNLAGVAFSEPLAVGKREQRAAKKAWDWLGPATRNDIESTRNWKPDRTEAD